MKACNRCGLVWDSDIEMCGRCGYAETAPSSVQSTALLGKIKTAWCHYNALNAELEYSLSEGGDTDVTRDQVNHAWDDLNDLIMPNAPRQPRRDSGVGLDAVVGGSDTKGDGQ